MAKKKQGGRPAGTRNSEHHVVTVIPAACPACGGTERESIRIVKEMPYAGVAPNGQPRTHIVWRRVRCRACSQYFIEREHQNRPNNDEDSAMEVEPHDISREMCEVAPDSQETIGNPDSCLDSEVAVSTDDP